MPDGPLAGYRVLDLADETASLCGKMFADLGADVVKVEPPGGCPTRGIPPLLDDGSSCYFLATAAGKRSVTVDIEDPAGYEVLLRLVETADFLVESAGLAHEPLAARNPRLIHTTVTPFGDRGPAAGWKAADIVVWAASGMMSLTGAPGRAPLQLTVPQAYFHAGAEAAVASMLAHLDQARTGLGQHVVVDAQAAGVWATNSETAHPAVAGRSLARTGSLDQDGHPVLYRCADGHVQLIVTGGMYLDTTVGLIDEFGTRPAGVDFAAWTTERLMAGELNDEIRLCEAEITELLARLPRAEILDRARRRGWQVLPVGTVEDVANDEQLAARQYFQRIVHNGREVTLAGPFARLSATPAPPARRAPLLGEHNDVILGILAAR